MPQKRRLPTDELADGSSTDVRVIIRAVARAFDQVLGHRSDNTGQLAQAGSGSAAVSAIRPPHHGHEHHFAQAFGHIPDMPVDGAMASPSVPSSSSHIDLLHPRIAPMIDCPILRGADAEWDDIMMAVPVHLTRSRCTQCHRCHDPARRCRCYACGSVHHSGIPCAMRSAHAQRCPICDLAHAPGLCAADTGPLATHCSQCGRCHLPTARCRCRLCGAMHSASVACNNVRASSIQDVHVGAAFSRQTVAAFDCGAPTETCPHCAALFFVGETQYLNCCRKGTIAVDQPTVHPHLHCHIYIDPHVMPVTGTSRIDEHNYGLACTLPHTSIQRCPGTGFHRIQWRCIGPKQHGCPE